ncbi:extracellular solute-binding protein [Zunongwangia sp. H14]|uniref:extracellular solute-binding protein n=1 Tax=Zunongwangia sp. H14 TaxID=3240792 RepID=UPI003567B83F
MKYFKIEKLIPLLALTLIFLVSACSTARRENNISKNEKDALSAKYTSTLLEPHIPYRPKDGIVKIYGAGGPQTAIIPVAKLYEEKTGTKVEVNFGPESKWTENAQKDADILWGTAEQGLTAFLETYTEFKSKDAEPIYLRPAAIAVKPGNPKNIHSIEDLFKPGIGIVVVEGAGVYNTSGTGVWEDVVGRMGRLEDLKKFRKNIIAFAKGSGAGFKAFKQPNADAWITWNYWIMDNPGEADLVEIDEARRIYRDLTVVTNDKADPQARDFIEFLKSDEAAKIFKSHGWDK